MSGAECKPDAERKRARSVSAIARNIKRSAQPQGRAEASRNESCIYHRNSTTEFPESRVTGRDIRLCCTIDQQVCLLENPGMHCDRTARSSVSDSACPSRLRPSRGRKALFV